MRIVNEPQVFLVAKTVLSNPGVRAYFDAIGLPEYELEGPSDGDKLVEMAGRLCYRSWQAYDESKPEATNPNVKKIREGNGPYVKNIIDSGHGAVLEHVAATLVFKDVSRVFTHELVRHRAGMAYCLSGDTQVWSGSQQKGCFDGIKRKWTLRQLFEWSQDRRRKGRIKLMTVRCYDGGQFVPARIKSVSYSGRKIVYRMRLEDGREIKASADHRFMGEGGWLPLRVFKVGNLIACNGKKWSQEAKDRFSQQQTGSTNPAWRGDAASPAAGRQRAQRRFQVVSCSRCGVDSDLVRHHKDRNPLNNEDPANIEVLCNPCHAKLHLEEDGPAHALRLDWKRIESITLVGEEDTYDLEIDHPAHNFVANGFVTHNSQESLRYVRLTDLPFWMPRLLTHGDMPESQRAKAMELLIGVVNYLEDRQRDLAEIFDIDDEKNFHIKKKLTSMFRRIAPIGLATSIMVTANLRSWRHVIELRTSPAAEEEIRLVISKAAHILKAEFPSSLQDMTQNDDGSITFAHSKV